MIIGEFNNSDFDSYEEDNYDYLFKRKPKAVRQEKRLTRKENHQQKKGGTGKRKHPLLGNFGMFDKNKGKVAATDNSTVAAIPSETDLEATSTSVSTPEPVLASALTQASVPPVPSERPAANSPEPEIRIPSSSLNTVLPSASDETKEEQSVAGRTSNQAETKTSGTVKESTKEPTKETAKKGSTVKEAGFSSMLGFAFLSIAIIAVGFALFRVDKKSNPQPIR